MNACVAGKTAPIAMWAEVVYGVGVGHLFKVS